MPAPKPERTDVCIIGAGASGAAAAQGADRARVSRRRPGTRPLADKETFGGDELANVNRYNLWPDPLLNPRTYRHSADEEAAVDLFCPVPQMVGGGTVHWQGWLPRFTPEDFRLHTIVGDLQGTSLADWPISYDDLEPYYTKVEWAFGVSGLAGANAYEGRAARATRARRCRCPDMRRSSTRAPELGLERFPDPAGRAVPPVQRPAGNGDQRLRPAARRPDRHPVQRAQRVHPGCTGHRPVRPAAGQLRPGIGRRRRWARSQRAVYQNDAGETFEQEADVFILACGAVETARLMLLSKSARFPNGIANGSDMVGRNVTFHEYSSAIGALQRPDLCLGRRRLRQRQFD